MLVTRVAQDPDTLQRGAQHRTRLLLLRREPVRERAIGIAEPEPLDQFPTAEATLVEIGQRHRARQQRLVVELDHLIEQRLVAGIEGERLRRAQLVGRQLRRRHRRRDGGD